IAGTPSLPTPGFVSRGGCPRPWLVTPRRGCPALGRGTWPHLGWAGRGPCLPATGGPSARGGGRPARPCPSCPPAPFCPARSSSELPARASGGVLHHDAGLLQLIPDRVGHGVVLAGPRGLALLERHADQRVHHLSKSSVRSRRPWRSERVKAEHRQHGSHGLRLLRRSRKIASGQGGVALRDLLVDDRQCLRNSQIIVQRGGEGGRQATDRRRRRAAVPGTWLRTCRAGDEPLDPAVCGGCLGERLRRVLDA